MKDTRVLHVLVGFCLFEIVSSQVVYGGKCPPLKPMKNFSPTRFLGRWYEIARYFVSFETLAGTCWVENYKYSPKNGHFTLLEWKDHLTGGIRTVENGITHDYKKPALLRYQLQRPPIPILRGQYKILATDYASYALAWQCDEAPLGVANTQILWFLSKNQHPSTKTIKHVLRLAQHYKLDTKQFEFQDRRNCPY